jgi:predicted DNA-binding transcriptional regulator AlpA
MPTPKPHRPDGPLPFVPRGLRTQLAALYVGVHPSTWVAMVKRNEAPAPVYLTGRIPVWLREDLDRWLDRRTGRAATYHGFANNPWDEA